VALIVTTTILDYTTAIIILDTTVAFVIPLVAQLMAMPVMWHKENLCNFSELQQAHFSNNV
jgi:hypothetical protein